MKIKENIISKIFEDPARKYYVRELAREAKVSPNSVINAVRGLEKEGLVRKNIKKHIAEISANLDSPFFIARKRVHNLSNIYESGIIDFLVKIYHPKAIVLFGSYSRGDDVGKSDIDIALITEKKETANVGIFEKKLGRKIHLMLLQYERIPDELYVNLINGIVIYGYLDRK